MLDKKYFLDYFDLEKLKYKNCLKNYKDRRLIFLEEINGEKYYIKKYIPHKQRKRAIAFGFSRDRAEHYKFISEKLKNIGIPHIDPELVIINKKSFFERESILVTKDGGVPLLEMPGFQYDNYFMGKFFEYFVELCKNGVYPTDYNLGGMLVNNNELYLIDFDAYRTNIFLTKEFKKYIMYKLEKNVDYIMDNLVYDIDDLDKKRLYNFLKGKMEWVYMQLKW